MSGKTGLYTWIIFSFLQLLVFPQSVEERVGIITYISKQNIYIRFDNTEGFNENDTLFFKEHGNFLPILIIKFISSRSVAGEPFPGIKAGINDSLFAFLKKVEQNYAFPKTEFIPAASLYKSDTKPVLLNYPREVYSGRIGILSYTNFSNINSKFDVQRWKYNLSFNAANISGTPLSFISQMNFTYRTHEWEEVQNNPGHYLRVYDLALNYKFDDHTEVWAGRFLNPRISSLSSIDGLQVEGRLSGFYTGLVVGTRPDFFNMGYNPKLFEYGLYAGRKDTVGTGYMENTAAIFQQTNNYITDRRFLYFQHTDNNLIPASGIFFSSEIDLFSKLNGKSKNDFNLTSIFASFRMTPVRGIWFTLSYDTRKNVIYYETYKNFIDSLIENESRQGFRGNININLIQNLNLSTGLNYGYRKNDLKPVRNYNFTATYSALPWVESSITASYNYLISSYLDGVILSAGLTKNLPIINMDLGLSYRNTKYKYTFSSPEETQNSFLVFAGIKITKKIHLNINYEGIWEGVRTSGRLFVDLTTRF